MDYHDQFYYVYDSNLSKYVYRTRIAADRLSVSGSNMDFEPSMDVVVARDSRVQHDPLRTVTVSAQEFQPFVHRNMTLDIVSPHQNVKMGFPVDDLEVYAGHEALVEIDGVLNSDTRFDEKFDVVLDLKSMLGATAVVVLSRFDNVSQYNKRFLFKAFGLLATAFVPNNYWIGLIIRASHLGTVDSNNDILTYSVSARVTLGSGFASWVIPTGPPLRQADVASNDDVEDAALDGWERV